MDGSHLLRGAAACQPGGRLRSGVIAPSAFSGFYSVRTANHSSAFPCRLVFVPVWSIHRPESRSSPLVGSNVHVEWILFSESCGAHGCRNDLLAPADALPGRPVAQNRELSARG